MQGVTQRKMLHFFFVWILSDSSLWSLHCCSCSALLCHNHPFYFQLCFKTHFFLTDYQTLNLLWKGVTVGIFRMKSPSQYQCWVTLWDVAVLQNLLLLFQALLGREKLLNAHWTQRVFIIIISFTLHFDWSSFSLPYVIIHRAARNSSVKKCCYYWPWS